MMNTIYDILDYYINFEIEEKLNNIVLNKDSYINLKKYNLTNLEMINSMLLEKKLDLIKQILNKVKFKNNENQNKLKIILDDIKNNNLDIQDNFDFCKIVDKNDYLFKDNYTKDAFEINRIIKDNKVYILYPVLASGKRKIPLVSFQVTIKDNRIIVNDYRIQINAFKVIISEILICDISDVENAMPDFAEFYESITSYENSDLFEILSFIEAELIGKFKHDKFNGLWNYKEFDKWAVTEEIVLTMESFGDMFFPPYQEEIEEVKYHLKSKQSGLLDQYLFGCTKDIFSEDIPITTHYGSYTSAYPINLKQTKVLNSYENARLLSISGPPGTGKTTVIKEIIANNIVKKAHKLIGIWNQEWEVIGKDNQTVYLSPLKGNCDFSMIIASSNNKAVDNIGLDLLNEIEYFNEILDDPQCNYKGVLCARLGNQENLDEFKHMILEPFISNLEKEKLYSEENSKEVINSFIEIETDINTMKSRITNYINNRDELIVKLLNTNLFNDGLDIQAVQDVYCNCGQELDLLASELRDLQQSRDSLNNEIKFELDKYNIESDILKKTNKELSLKRQYLDTLKHKSNIFLIGRILAHAFEKKVGSKDNLYYEISLLENDYVIHKKQYDQIYNEYQNIEQKIIDTNMKINTVNDKINSLQNTQSLCEAFDSVIIEFEKLNKLENINWDSDEYFLFNNDYLVKQRYELFIKSLSVIKNYIYKNALPVKNNLKKVYPDKWFQSFYRRDYRYNDSYEKYLKGMWETLFLCFPVITTTLYSFNRMKFHLIQGIFDTLLIDEAGQASIHTVIAPLYRFREAIIVGDPNQIEPISSKNNYVIEKSNIDDQMKQLIDVNLNSIQNAGDRASDIYDVLDDKKVGIILNEHRRCEKSIAEFSNKYVYKNQLKVIKDDKIKDFLKYSFCMVDVRSIEQSHHVNNTEIEMCAKIIDALISIYGNDYKKNIGIITPFRRQANALKKRFSDIECGTVHVFQGREKEIILFSIVTGNIGKKNSMEFIGRKANNLNVAFTRAKKQLILIGNYEACINANNFMSSAMHVLNEKGKLYSIYENDLFDDETLEDKYKQQFYTLFVGDNSAKKPLDIELEKYIIHGLIETPQKHNSLLNNILTKIDKSINIVTPWIRANVVDENFLNKISQLVSKGKEVNICFGYHKTNYDLSDLECIIKTDNYGKIEDDISQLTKLYYLLNKALRYNPPIHCKIMILDDRIMIIGSHNWLSNTGKAKNAKNEISCVIYDKDMISYIKERFIN